MNAWTWVLVGLCVAGAVLVFVSLAAVALAAIALNKKLKALRQQPILLSAQMMQMQANRLSHIAAQAEPLVQRGRAAGQSISESLSQSGIAESRAAMEGAGAELRALGEELT
jgi:hypothetical protein